MATVRLLLGLWALGVVSLLPVAWTQVTSECPMIQTNEIGSTESPSTNGLIARSYVLQAGGNPQPPNVQLFASNIVCLATGPTRERYRSVSLVANFSCSGAVCNNSNVASQVAQFHFECILGAWTASSQGSTDFLRTDSPVGTLSTALRRDCSLCIDPMQLPHQLVDQSTHCLPCPAACIGTRTCLSSLPSDCCNFYDTNGGCVAGCPSGEVPNSPFQCSAVLFTFRQPMYMIMESLGNMAMVCVDKLGNTTETFAVSVTASGGERNWTESLLFQPEDTEMCLSPRIQDDNVALEGVETFTLSLGFPAGQLRADLGQYNTTSVMVIDDDELVLTVDTPPVVPENIGTTQVCIQFSAPFVQPFSIPAVSMATLVPNITTITNMFSAIPGVDYASINMTLDVTPQDSDAGEVCFNVTIVDDSEVEPGLECLMVTIRLPDAPSMVRIADGNGSVMICIMDDDQVPPQPVTQCVVRSTINTTSDITTFDETATYSFNRTCEHILATSCDTPASDFSILIDQLDGQLFTSKVGVYYRNIAAVFDSGDLEVISGDPSQYEVQTLSDGERLILRELGNLSVSYVREALGVSVRVTIDESVLPNVCGLCGNVIGQPVLRNSSVVDISGEAQLQQFVDEYFVNPGETRLRQIERQQCGLIRNDTVIGDPLYTVPVFGTQERHLCYEIHGRPMRYFNLISDSCVSVNAHYVQRMQQITVNGVTESEALNVIDQIGIRAVDNMGTCVNIAVNVLGCAASVNGMSRLSYQQAGVRMRRFSNHVRIVVPNCADTNLVMRVFCQNISGIEMIKFVVSRGLNIREVAHGLIGQFWNIPISVEPYTGVTRDGSTNVYIVTVTPPNGKQRAFPAWREDQTWDGTDIPCLYAGSRQGGPVYEVQDPNDPLIEGRYYNYIVDGPFATQYQYSHFEENRCR